MSSLAASKSDNFYYPPEWEPSMGSISKFQGSKGKNQYEQFGIIRFELPFDAWCLKCNLHMSKGLRFNAKKDRAGKYFSTTIWEFTMKCFDCNQTYIIRTNPKDNTYDFVEGLRKHEQDYDIGTEEGVVELTTDEQRLRIDTDPMYRLQHTEQDKSRTQSAKQNLRQLQQLQDKVVKHDYDLNSLLRKCNRTIKKRDKQMLDAGNKRGLSMPLLDISDSDRQEANQRFLLLHHNDDRLMIKEKLRLKMVEQQSIFDNTSKSTTNQSSSISLDTIGAQLLNRHQGQEDKSSLTTSILLKRKRKHVEPETLSLSKEGIDQNRLDADVDDSNVLSLLSNY
jgi:coiled-coil domain-containing protein 130